MAAPLRALLRGRAPRAKVNLFASYTKHEEASRSSCTRSTGPSIQKMKDFANKKWNDLDTRIQASVIDGVGTLFFIGIPSCGFGYYFCIRSIRDERDLIEKQHQEMKQEFEKALIKSRDLFAAKEDAFSRYQEECELRYQKLQAELKEIRFLKELWMASVIQSDKDDLQ